MSNRHIYTDEDRDYAIANYNKISNHEVAKVIGVTTFALRRMVFKWREKGFVFTEIQNGNPDAIGTINKRNVRGKEIEFIKTEKGWHRLNPTKAGRPKGYPKTGGIKKSITNKPVSVKSKKALLPQPVKKEVKVFANKPQLLKEKVPVYIPEKRMVVYVNKGIDINKVRQKYISC